MEEKARLYAALKSVDIEGVDDKYGVDFDQKWADAQGSGAAASASESESAASEDQQLVEYVDEFGRTREHAPKSCVKSAARAPSPKTPPTASPLAPACLSRSSTATPYRPTPSTPTRRRPANGRPSR